MSDLARLPIASDADVVAARQLGRSMAAELGFGSSDLTRIATAISEIARNIVHYAERGEIRLEQVKNGTRDGLRVVAEDHGPGIPDIARALQDGYTSGGGLGLGLPGSRRLMDDFAIESEVGKGTRVTMVKWKH